MQIHAHDIKRLNASAQADFKRAKPGQPRDDCGAMAKTRELTPRELAVMVRIESAMKARDLTWASLARAVGKSANLGSQWSSRRSFPREADLYQAAKILGVGMGWLLTGEEPSAEVLAQTATEKEMLAVLRTMAPDQQRAVLAQARALRDNLSKK